MIYLFDSTATSSLLLPKKLNAHAQLAGRDSAHRNAIVGP